MLATSAPWALLVLLLLALGCRSITAPHDLPVGQGVDGTVEFVEPRAITDPATLDEIEAEYRDVSECLGVPFDPGKLRLARFYTASAITWNGGPAGGVTISEYIYVVSRDGTTPSLRHELVHYITGRHDHEGPGWHCVDPHWREAT